MCIDLDINLFKLCLNQGHTRRDWWGHMVIPKKLSNNKKRNSYTNNMPFKKFTFSLIEYY